MSKYAEDAYQPNLMSLFRVTSKAFCDFFLTLKSDTQNTRSWLLVKQWCCFIHFLGHTGRYILQIFFLAGNFSSLVFYFRNQPRKNKNKNILHSIMWSHQLCIGLKLGCDNWHCMKDGKHFSLCLWGEEWQECTARHVQYRAQGENKVRLSLHWGWHFLKFMGGRVTGIHNIILIVILVNCRPSFWFYVSFLPIANHDMACSHLDKFV